MSEKSQEQTELRKQKFWQKNSARVSTSPELAFQSWIGISPEPLAGYEIWKLWHSLFDPPWENGHWVGRADWMSKNHEGSPPWEKLTFCLKSSDRMSKSVSVVHLDKMENLSEEFRREVKRLWVQSTLRKWRLCRKSEEFQQDVQTSWTCFSTFSGQFSLVTCWLRDFKIMALFIWPTSRNGHCVGRVPTGCLKTWRQSTLRKWTFCQKSSNRMSKNHEGSPPWENGHLVGRVPKGFPKIVRAVHLEKMNILSEDFRQDVQKSSTCFFSILRGQFSWATCWLRHLKIVALFVWPTLRKWKYCWKSSDPRLAVQSWVGSSSELLAGYEIWKLWHSAFDPPWENGHRVSGRLSTGCPKVLDLLFNLGLEVLLSHLMVKRVENCGTLCLTHRKFVRHVGAEFLWVLV